VVRVEIKRLRRAAYSVLFVAAAGLGIAALMLLSRSTQNSEQFGRLQDYLLMINAAAALILLLLIIGNLIRLFGEYRRRVPGARLKARMLAAFVVLSVGPLLIVYVFAVQFLNEGIETWFDIEMERGLADAMELSRGALDVGMREELKRTRGIATAMSGLSQSELISGLSDFRRKAGALELTVFGENDRIIATSAEQPAARLPDYPPEDISMQVRQTGAWVGLDPVPEGTYRLRAVVVLGNTRTGGGRRVLQAFYPVGERLGTLVDSIENSYSRYSELLFLREPLKLSFTVTLTLVVLLSFLAALSGAFFFARRLVAPIKSLVDGTRSVAKGDLDTRLPSATHDEIGFLVDSFNLMIQRLAIAREEAKLNAQRVESERAQLEAILARLSTGVIAVDAAGRIRRANAAAGTILRADIAAMAGRPLDERGDGISLFSQFVDLLRPHLVSAAAEWREQITLRADGARHVLVCACAELPAEDGGSDGKVIVFDEVTAMLQAQRDAAWREVARRLAHEIKNPLTPIQLSAERIRRRYLGSLKDMEAQVLDRATHTIVQQVEAMRDMVNAFSDYARAPEITLSRVQLNRLVREVADLYRTRDDQPAVLVETDERIAEVTADAVRIRQMLHNLIRNATEALEDRPAACVRISTTLAETDGGSFVEIRVSDNGPGFDPRVLEQVFEPYVTSKARGTGLGLAIVKKLVEEHGGTVTAGNSAAGGAEVRVCLPVNAAETMSAPDAGSGRNEHRRERA